jgi:uncharacterized protein YecT (DUF1311 family)
MPEERGEVLTTTAAVRSVAMIRCLICLAALVCLAEQAVAGGETVDCSRVAERQVYACSVSQYEAADRDLNDVYRKVMADQQNEASRGKLKAAQRNWLQFRDNECTFETAEYEGGRLEDPTYRMCRTKLARARTKQLRDTLECQKDAGTCGR